MALAMNFDSKLLYVWLVLFIVFFVWRILTHPLNRIHRAAMGGDIETVKQGSINIARLLLENGAEVNLRSRWGNIPLDYLAQHDLEMADLLVSYGANAKAKN